MSQEKEILYWVIGQVQAKKIRSGINSTLSIQLIVNYLIEILTYILLNQSLYTFKNT